MPVDFVPDVIPVLRWFDDVAILKFALDVIDRYGF